jgi:Ni/Co efflux regulator RcnB
MNLPITIKGRTMLIKKFLPASLIAAMLVTALSTGPALADKPEGVGHGKNDKSDKHENKGKNKKQKYEGDTADVRVNMYFNESQRTAVRDYYGQQYKTGRCPPGLAKKNNGCMPPGQAKKWAVGQPLPGGVVYYPVPSPVLVQLGTPPAGHKYVRVASDILLIAIGTGLIVDAIQDLGRL